MTKNFKFYMVSMPDFLYVERPAKPRQEGVSFINNMIPVGELTKEEAEQYAEEMKQAFIAHWKERSATA